MMRLAHAPQHGSPRPLFCSSGTRSTKPGGLHRETAKGGFKQMPMLGFSKTREVLEETKDPSTGAGTHISNKTEKSQFLSSEM